MMIKLLLNYLFFHFLCISIHSFDLFDNQTSNCKYPRDSRMVIKQIAGKEYDTLVPLGDGLDGKVEHAYSRALGRCVAVKTCLEDPERLNKCTRELEVMKRLREAEPAGGRGGHIVQLLDFEITPGQPCSEGAVVSDFIRTIVLGSERRRRRRENAENGTEFQNNCNKVVIVEELGIEDTEHYVRRMKNGKGQGQDEKSMSIEDIKAQIEQGMAELHALGIAHRDMHKDNAMMFPVYSSNKTAETRDGGQQQKLVVKLIDMGWACCFDARKCGTRVAAVVPKCTRHEALGDDAFSLQDVIRELNEIGTGAGSG